MTVTFVPLTLRTSTGLVIATRLVFPPITFPPVWYVPFVTMISSPELAASIASWINFAAVLQSLKGGTGFGLLPSTYNELECTDKGAPARKTAASTARQPLTLIGFLNNVSIGPESGTRRLSPEVSPR